MYNVELVCTLGHKCILCFDVGEVNKMKGVGNFASQTVTKLAILTCIMYLWLYIVDPYIYCANSILYTIRQL